jgi:hypothetical protein
MEISGEIRSSKILSITASIWLCIEAEDKPKTLPGNRTFGVVIHNIEMT